MATRRRIIEGTWACSSCGTTGILGRNKLCPSCGSPREKEEMKFNFGAVDSKGASNAATVQDPEALRLAGVGADWTCPSCQAGNAGDKSSCRSCGTPRVGLVGAGAVGSASEGAPGRGRAEAPETAGPGALWRLLAWIFGLFTWRRILAVGLLVGLSVGGWAWSQLTHDVQGQVVGRTWSRSERVERFTSVTLEDWRDRLSPRPAVMPVKGEGGVAGVSNIRGCETRQSGTVQVADGTREVCQQSTRSVPCGETESCTVNDLGNGFAEEVCSSVTTYCDEPYTECHTETTYHSEPVYSEWCSYDTYEWKVTRSESRDGTEDTPVWPGLRAHGDLERLVQSEAYTITFGWTEDDETATWTSERAGLADWKAWPKGGTALVTVNNLGDVKKVRKPDATK